MMRMLIKMVKQIMRKSLSINKRKKTIKNSKRASKIMISTIKNMRKHQDKINKIRSKQHLQKKLLRTKERK